MICCSWIADNKDAPEPGDRPRGQTQGSDPGVRPRGQTQGTDPGSDPGDRPRGQTQGSDPGVRPGTDPGDRPRGQTQGSDPGSDPGDRPRDRPRGRPRGQTQGTDPGTDPGDRPRGQTKGAVCNPDANTRIVRHGTGNMGRCLKCGSHLNRSHRRGFERLIYSEVFRCAKCRRPVGTLRPFFIANVKFVLSRHTRCIRCGTPNVHKRSRRDRVDSVSTHPLSLISYVSRAPVYKCNACRLQYMTGDRPALLPCGHDCGPWRDMPLVTGALRGLGAAADQRGFGNSAANSHRHLDRQSSRAHRLGRRRCSKSRFCIDHQHVCNWTAPFLVRSPANPRSLVQVRSRHRFAHIRPPR